MEQSPYIDKGRPLSARATQLDLDHYRMVLSAVRALPNRSLPDAIRARGVGVTLRLDATSGLLALVGAMRESERETDVSSFLSISCFAGDLTIVKEGVVRIDPRLFPLLKVWAGEVPIGLLNELPDAFLASGRTPWTVLKELADQLAEQDIQVAGVVTPHLDEAATELALLLEHHGMFTWAPESFFEPYGLYARELIDVGPKPIEKLPCLDWIEEVRLAPQAWVQPVYSRRLRRAIAPRSAIVRRYGADYVVLSTPTQWRVIATTGGDRDEVLDTSGLIKFLGATAHRAAVLVICRPEHFAGPPASAPPAPGTLRDLPAPFDSYLALASDVDWSTPAKAAECERYLGEELGLPTAGSFFLSASHARWISAFDRQGRPRPPDPQTGWSVESMAAGGALDTFHHWTNSVFQADLTGPDRSGARRPVSSVPIGWGFGFLIRSPSQPCLTATLEMGGEVPLRLAATAYSDRADPGGFYQSFLPLPEGVVGRLDGDWTLRLPTEPAGAHVVLTDLDPSKCREMLECLAARGVHPPVYNPHGGNVRDIGNLRGARLAARLPNDAVFDLDETASIYGLFDELYSLGVRFVSIIGETFRRDLAPYSTLLKPHTLRSGKTVWCFSRFLSRRAQELKLGLWCYGKNIQHAAGIGFQISDILQRLHWCEPACGAIVYTHLGHTEFDQTGDRLTWKADVYSSFAQLATSHHPDGEEASTGRPWVSATSTLLLHRAVADKLQEHLSYRDNCIEIAPWRDPLLRLMPASSAEYSSRFLHGQCIHVDNAATARVHADGVNLPTLARTRVTDGTDCVTVVDDTCPMPLLLSLNSATRQFSGARLETADRIDDWRHDIITILPDASEFEAHFDIPSLSLAHQWAWMMDMRAESMLGIAIALRDGRGEYFEASDDAGAQWEILPDVPIDGDGWRRLVFEFANRRGHTAGRPEGGITGLRIRSRGPSGRRIEIGCAALLRPASICVDPADTHRLGGRVLDQHGRPLGTARARIEIASQADTQIVDPDTNGFFEVGGLARHRIYAVEAITPGGRWTCARGRYFAATRDCWDWNIAAPG